MTSDDFADASPSNLRMSSREELLPGRRPASALRDTSSQRSRRVLLLAIELALVETLARSP